MSSQSTLVRREPYEELDTSYGIMDMIGPEIGRGHLTESRINAHMREEARRHNHRRGDDYDEAEVYPGGGKRRRHRPRAGELVVTPEHEGMVSAHVSLLIPAPGGSPGPRQPQVSPGNDQAVHIASDTEVQNVIEFLSKSVYTPDPLSNEGEAGGRGESSQTSQPCQLVMVWAMTFSSIHRRWIWREFPQ